MTIRGRSAERAIQLAATHYKRANRADIAKQATPMRKTQSGWQFSRKSAIDFRGTIQGGLSIAIEVKQHSGVSFPLNDSTLPNHQRLALDQALGMGGQVWLVVDLPDAGETFICDWKRVQEFLCAPYRASLSLQWLRAHAYLCKATDRDTDRFRIWFLDYVDHPHRETAYLAEATEKASKPVIELDAPIERIQTRIAISKEERIAGVRDAIDNGKYRKQAKKGWMP